MRLRIARVLLVGVTAAATISCVGMYESMYPLSDEAKRVLLAPSGQAASVELASRCNKTGRIQPVMSEHFARLKAAEVDANVAQVLTATTINGRVHRLDVRFWTCPGNVAKLRFEG